MPWDIPGPDDIADQWASLVEAFPAVDADGNPMRLDARSPNRLLAVQARAAGLTQFDLYLYLAWIARELMVDSAIDWLPRHGDIWGIPRVPAQIARGTVAIVDAPGTALPAGIALTQGGVTWTSTAAAQVGAGGTVSVPLAADVAGAGGNLAAGAVLQFVSPVPGVAASFATVDAAGLAGGAEAEEVEAWRGRILARIRMPGAAGDDADYVGWARAAGAGYVGVFRGWQGAGTVGVVILMPGPAVPNSAQVAAVQAAIDAVRPTTAQAIVVAGQLLPVPVTLHLNPDTAAIRAAAQAALATQFAADQKVGGPIYRSRLDIAVGVGDGETSHVISAPAGDVTPAQNQMPVLGPVGFV